MALHGGLYLFTGPDRAGKFQRIQAMERALGIQPFDRHHLDAAETPPAQLLALCRQRPAASPVRFIVVDQAHRVDREAVGALLQHAELIAHNACLIFLIETELTPRQALSRAQPLMVTEQFPLRQAPAAKPFAFTDALGRRDVIGALTAAHEQLAAGKEPLELLGLVAWQLQRWVMVKRLEGEGYHAARIGAASGLRAWQVERAQSEVARRSITSLQRMLERCWQLDVESKSGRHVPALALEQLVFEVCLETIAYGSPISSWR